MNNTQSHFSADILAWLINECNGETFLINGISVHMPELAKYLEECYKAKFHNIAGQVGIHGIPNATALQQFYANAGSKIRKTAGFTENPMAQFVPKNNTGIM